MDEDFARAVQELQKDQEKAPEKPKKRGRKKKEEEVEEETKEVDIQTALLNNEPVANRLPEEKEKIIVKAPSYYMENRRIFSQKLGDLFSPFKKDLKENKQIISCDVNKMSTDFDLLTHQKVVRDYLNLYTPYRGLLIYHGLGSGKTCTSIAMAEGMKSNKRVFVLTPASLKMNFFSEMKKCGDALYKKNQYWEFIDVEGNQEYLGILSRALNLSKDEIMKKKSNNRRGAWMVNINQEPNYTTLSVEDQLDIDNQLNHMIRSKYFDINYNELNNKKMELITGNYSRNPFDNSVVVIDEAHNFVSRIVNKLTTKEKVRPPISIQMYRYLMSAENAKIIMLSGTPLINYPNELAVLYNILRGHIVSYKIPIEWRGKEKMNRETILHILEKGGIKNYDYIDYTKDTLEITRNPFGFINTKKRGVAKGTKKKGGKRPNVTRKNYNKIAKEIIYDQQVVQEEDVNPLNTSEFTNPYYGGDNELFNKYNGVKLDETGNMTQEAFLKKIVDTLQDNKIIVSKDRIEANNYHCLPDDKEQFLTKFIDVETAKLKNSNIFKKRILGLTSYFRSAQEDLLPDIVKTENDTVYHIEKVEFSDYQFSVYEKIRKMEADKTKKMNKAKRMNKGKDEDIYGVASTYRVFSRAYCNYVFPIDVKDVIKSELNIVEDELEEDVFDEKFNNSEMVKKAMNIIDSEKDGVKTYLTPEQLEITSPKFFRLLQHVTSLDNEGLHLIYSHFRTVYGIGVFRLVLLANGFAEFKLQKSGGSYIYEEKEEEKSKPKFVLYTGTETPEEKEIVRNVYNGNWDYVPLQIAEKLKETAENNNNGEIIKVMMITSSGAEGINLRNTRFVHIIEPYWHNVRLDQVVGRARRICSHTDLPKEKQNVKVFLYMATLSEKQKVDKNNIELTIRDLSRIDNKSVVSTDETLFEIASIKEKINKQLLVSMKESAIDCELYKHNSDENLVCYGFGKVSSNQYSSYPSFEKDLTEKEGDEVKEINWTPIKLTIQNIDYAYNEKTRELYDYRSYEDAITGNGELLYIGKLVRHNNNYKII